MVRGGQFVVVFYSVMQSDRNSFGGDVNKTLRDEENILDQKCSYYYYDDINFL